mgnify:CR=1 FL=1|tara:strand:+ start:331 stop:570 length:240 start_codon:yes stop_codon:yes gene_type:complete
MDSEIKEVNETLTWKQVVQKYHNKDIWLKLSRTAFWSWADKDIPEFYITQTSKVPRENFMTSWNWQDFYSNQGISLFKR